VKVGIIDLGTNTFNLIIAEIDEKGGYTHLYKSKVGVKLGEGSFSKNYITEAAMQRAFVALEAQINAIKNHYCDRILCFATSAIRNASNGADFVEKVKAKFGMTIYVIDGNREAELIYNGVRLSGALSEDNALIMDIGGGSTEFIIASQGEIHHASSFEIGVTRLRERFSPSDPLSEKDIAEMEGLLDGMLGEVYRQAKEKNVGYLVGCSGSFDTLSNLLAYRLDRFEEMVGASTVDFEIEPFKQLLSDLIKSERSEREAMEGMAALRINIIAISALMTRLVMDRTGIDRVTLSKFSLKEGVLFDVLKGKL